MRAIAVLLVLPVLLIAATARGELCPAPPGGSAVGAIDSVDRAAWLQERLEGEQHRVRLWTYGWLIESAALGVGQLAALPLLGRATRIDAAVGGVASLIGGAPLVFLPMKLVHADLSLSSFGTCASLAEREGLLEENAADEAFGRGIVAQVASIAYCVALGLVLGLGWGHWVTGAISLAVGIGISEARIFSQPAGSASDWPGYWSPAPSLYFGAAPAAIGKPMTWVVGAAF